MNEKQTRSVKLLIGIATLIFLFWFVRESGVVAYSLQQPTEEGKLGNPAVAGAFAILAEILVAIGGVVIVMLTGLWRWVADLVAPFLPSSQQGLTGEEFVHKALTENRLSPERRAQLEQALAVCIDLRDAKGLVAVAELLAGEEFFPRPSRETKK